MNAKEGEIQLLQMRNLCLKLGRQASPSVVALLCDTVWGTPGGMRYQHLDTASKIHDLRGPWFLFLEKDEEAVGVLCLDQRKAGTLDSFYIRYFSFAESMRRRGVAVGSGEATASRGQGIFKRFSSQFFEKPEALLAAAGTSSAVFYAFVEMENARSRDMVSQMGLETCGQFNTLIFSRLFPRKNPQIRRARPEEYVALRQRVAAAYADHAFFEDHGLFYQGEFFVLEINGEIVAGCQSQPVHWQVVEIPGLAGKLMMRILPHLPLLNRLFNPRKFNFSGIEGLFCTPGQERSLQGLLAGVLASQGTYAALLWMSPQAEMYRLLHKNIRWGLLQSLKKDVSASVAMRAYNLTAEQVADLKSRPVYVSAFDAT